MNAPRRLIVGLGIVAAAALLGWFTLGHSSSKNRSSSGMGDMTMTMGETSTESGHDMGGMSMGGSPSMGGMTPLVAGADGTKASADGLTLEPNSAVMHAGPSTWQLRVVGSDGMTVTKFERDQTKLMHLIVVRNDLTGYQHLHPKLGRGGIFSVELRLSKPGTYRAIADFTTGGRRYALGVPVTVAGKAADTPLPPEAMSADTDGYSVTLAHAKAIMAGSEAKLQFMVEKDGRPVTALLPYLAVYGHLVALRASTLAYSHVHPTSEDRAKGMIDFTAEFPKRGAYRLFLQFRTESGVHTAAYTLNVS